MRYLVECTYVLDHPNDNTGIQRVVRNVINKLPGVREDAECVPVAFRGGDLYRVRRLAPQKYDGAVSNARRWMRALKHRYWYAHARLHDLAILSDSPRVRGIIHRLFTLFAPLYLLPAALVEFVATRWFDGERIEPLTVADDDVLVLLDSSWQYDFFPQVVAFKKRGIKVVGVIYDLIPLTHPQFCDKHLVKVFEEWFDWIAQHADGFMCISKTIAEEVKEAVHLRLGTEQAQQRWYGHFYLGSELDLTVAGEEIAPSVKRVFTGGRSVYLMVGTIEPRKNHVYLLDAFELLWEQGIDVALCLVGKVGWKCEALVDRIEKHPELNRRLFMLNGLADAELEYCYREAKRLVFPSYVEGFGLPLVEALERQLPAMASDIPVFREVGGSSVSYFDLAKPASLATDIKALELPGVADVDLDGWSWIGWQESAEQLIRGVDAGLQEKA